MWGAIERISNDLQELVQRDVGTEGEEDGTDLVLVTPNLDKEASIPDATKSWIPPKTEPDHWPIPIIPEEEVASVKDSVTSRLPSREQNLGAEANGSGGVPA